MPKLHWPTAQTPEISPLAARIVALEGLLGMLVPAATLAAYGNHKPSKKTKSTGGGSANLECLPCESYKELVLTWQQAMEWTNGLDYALTVMLASIASTKSVGDQLWVKVIGPASCGKSTLCEAVSVNKKYVFPKSTIRGFHSGFVLDGSEKEDHSLIARLYGKTLVTKDGDTLLQSPNLAQILAEARDIYDGTSRTHYRNAKSKDYEGLRMTWILCGTKSLQKIDESELGERFLDCVLMHKIDDELEDEVLWRVANRADRDAVIESEGEAEKQYAPELAKAMQLTGGYVGYLRSNAMDLLPLVENSDEAKRACTRLGKFIAHMRARPSNRQEGTAEREFAARLVSQLVRLAKCLALVLNRESVDESVMSRVRRVALDTSRGQTLKIVTHLYGRVEGSESRAISVRVNLSTQKVSSLLAFLREIGVVERFKTKKTSRVASGVTRWRLTRRMRELYKEVSHED
ncbi:hypothetical protein LCGC14_0429010 [marine sediment metagenome]|uniref:Uncharacterized protein n=1 Tax=marine sediment metagenome TaxID=412755 RepID=A0A0F9VY26_9ZZZZ